MLESKNKEGKKSRKSVCGRLKYEASERDIRGKRHSKSKKIKNKRIVSM